MVLLLEDLHWFDAQSAAFLERLIAQFPGSRTLVLTNFRPEFTAPWLGASYYRSLPLRPLDSEAAGVLLAAMLGDDPSLASLVPLITERTGGNPFFVEEIVRDLVEAGTLVGLPGAYRLDRPVAEISVPRTVHATLAARIDRLPPDERRALQTAAVIGRTFPASVLSAVTGTDADEVLSSLCGRELLQAIDPGTFRFWHPLTQEVAAATLLTERRSAVHAAVARALIDADPDRLDEHAALIATHWEAAGEAWEGARWNARAAEQAVRHDIAESVRRWERTIAHLDGVEGDEAIRLGVRARARLVRWGNRTGLDDRDVQRLLDEGRALAERGDEPHRLVMDMVTAAGAAFLWRGRIADAFTELSRLPGIAEQSGDAGLLAASHLGVALARRRIGPVSAGLEDIDRSLALEVGDWESALAFFGFSPLGCARFLRAELLGLAGERAAARQSADEAVRLFRERSDIDYLGWSLSVYAQVAETAEEYEVAYKHATEAFRMADDSANAAGQVIALTAAGTSLCGLHRFPEAVEALTQGLDLARSLRVALFDEGVLLAHLAAAHLATGRLEAAAAAADEAVEVARRQGAPVIECHAHLVRARVGRASGDPAAQVAADVAAGLALVEQTGAVLYEAELRQLA